MASYTEDADGGDLTGTALVLRLRHRPPLAWRALLAFLHGRAIPGVELVSGECYRRTVRLGGAAGAVEVRPDPGGAALVAAASPALARVVRPLVGRLRALFDLDARPAVVDAHLAGDPRLAPLVAARPGLRVPGAFDAFELAVRAVLGQQTTVRGASTLAGRLVARFGTRLSQGTVAATAAQAGPSGDAGSAVLTHVFPEAAVLAAASEGDIAAIGLPRARAGALRALAQAFAQGGLRLERASPPQEAMAALEALPGIGPWTASYVAMRALRWSDAFPAADLGLRKALGGVPAASVAAAAEPWRPWRAYAAMHLWCSLPVVPAPAPAPARASSSASVSLSARRLTSRPAPRGRRA